MPDVVAAFFCERLLRERDGVLSPIRIVRRVTRKETGEDAPDEMPETTIRLKALIILRSMQPQPGPHEVSMKCIAPNGTAMFSATTTIDFSGKTGFNLDVDFRLMANEAGMYWTEFYYDKQLLTKMDLEVEYIRDTQPPADEYTTGGI